MMNKDVEIFIVYAIKGKEQLHVESFSPKDYYYDLTEEEIRNHYVDCVVQNPDHREDIKNYPNNEIAFTMAIEKNYYLKRTNLTFTYYFDNKKFLMLNQVMPFEFPAESVVVYGEDDIRAEKDLTDETVRLELGSKLFLDHLWTTSSCDIITQFSKEINLKELGIVS